MSKYGEAIDFLEKKNTGTRRNTKNYFFKIFQYFIIGGDETWVIACVSGIVKIIL